MVYCAVQSCKHVNNRDNNVIASWKCKNILFLCREESNVELFSSHPRTGLFSFYYNLSISLCHHKESRPICITSISKEFHYIYCLETPFCPPSSYFALWQCPPHWVRTFTLLAETISPPLYSSSCRHKDTQLRHAKWLMVFNNPLESGHKKINGNGLAIHRAVPQSPPPATDDNGMAQDWYNSWTRMRPLCHPKA